MERFAQEQGQKYAKKLFKKHMESVTPSDPLYEVYTDERGRPRKREREVPLGLSKRDEKILRSVKRRAHYLDKGFSVCGMRFGWTFVIGFIPVVGDCADLVLNYLLVVRKAKQAEIPGWLLSRMLLNNAISAGVGFIPFVGDVALAAYKANSRNAWLLTEFLAMRGAEMLKAQAARTEDLNVIRPGAGLEHGEKVPGQSEGKVKSLGNLWREKAQSAAKA